MCAGNIQVSINQIRTEIKYPLIAYEDATFSSQAIFNNFSPQTDTEPAVANDLVKLSYFENKFWDLGTSQSISGEKTFTGDITTENINCKTALYFTDIVNYLSPNKPQILMQNDVVYFDTLVNYDNTFRLKCVFTKTCVILKK